MENQGTRNMLASILLALLLVIRATALRNFSPAPRGGVTSASNRARRLQEVTVNDLHKAEKEAEDCVTELINNCPALEGTISAHDTTGDLDESLLSSFDKEQYQAFCEDCGAAYNKFAECSWNFIALLAEASVELGGQSSDHRDSLESSQVEAARALMTCKCDYPVTDECLDSEAKKFVAASPRVGSPATAAPNI